VPARAEPLVGAFFIDLLGAAVIRLFPGRV